MDVHFFLLDLKQVKFEAQKGLRTLQNFQLTPIEFEAYFQKQVVW